MSKYLHLNVTFRFIFTGFTYLVIHCLLKVLLILENSLHTFRQQIISSCELNLENYKWKLKIFSCFEILYSIWKELLETMLMKHLLLIDIYYKHFHLPIRIWSFSNKRVYSIITVRFNDEIENIKKIVEIIDSELNLWFSLLLLFEKKILKEQPKIHNNV